MTGLSTHTLRYYEQAGLLRAISRTAAGHRLCTWTGLRDAPEGDRHADRANVRGAARARRVDFRCARSLLVAHHEAVRAHIAELQASLDVISDKIVNYEAQGGRWHDGQDLLTLSRNRTDTMERLVEDRYTRGWNKLKEIDGEVGERVIAALAPIAPDFGRL